MEQDQACSQPCGALPTHWGWWAPRRWDIWVSTAIVLIPPFPALWERAMAFPGCQRNPNPAEQLQETSRAHRSVRPSKICPSPLGAATRPQASTCTGQVRGPWTCFLLPHLAPLQAGIWGWSPGTNGTNRQEKEQGTPWPETSIVMQAFNSFPSMERQEKNIWPYTSSFTTSAKYLYGISHCN